MNKMNILISSAGRRVSLLRSFQKELKKINSQSRVFASDINPELSGACHVADLSFKVPHSSNPDYITTLIELCLKNDIKLIIPTIDTELIIFSKHKELFLDNGIKVVVSSVDFIKVCRDKRQIHEFFKSNNIEVSKEYTKDNYKLPMFLKPWDGSRSVDTFLINSKEDITDYHINHDKLMFLEYIDHELYDEYTCDLYYGIDNILKCVVPRKRIQVRDGEVNKGLTIKNELVPYIKERLHHVKGVEGCLTAQFFKHKIESKIYGIEINPRFGGGYPLSYMAGANYSRWILEEYLLGKTIHENFNCCDSDLLMLRYDSEILVHGYKG